MQDTILGRKIEVVNASAGMLEVAYRIVGPRATYELVHVGGGLLQPRNQNRAFCSIAGNYFFWVSAVGEMHCGTRDQRAWQRASERSGKVSSSVVQPL